MASTVSLFFLCFLCFVTLTFPFEPANPEVEALIAIKKELNDPHGVLSKWDEDSVDPCSWAMITCSIQNLVIGLGAPSQGLSMSGTLSGIIGNLTNLQQILLQNNNITGEIPAELGLLSNIQTIDLSSNGFSGRIPDSMGHLKSLRYLRLNNNSLSGAFPASLSKVPQLSFLDLSYNNLSGPVPIFPARTFNIVGNPLICGRKTAEECSRTSSQPVSFPFFFDRNQREPKSQKLAVALGCSLGATLLLLTGLFLWWRKKQKRQYILGLLDKDEESSTSVAVGLGNLRQFKLRELLAATDNFSARCILGKGGFGNVYKGVLSDGTIVAVKRLKDAGRAGEAQFKTEVEMISLAVHRHLLRLIGYCVTATERILVYPYLANGSVASRLRGKPPLDWSTRKRIALGAARGLLYLHEQCDPKIIHRDVKAANVLLDESYEAVVGDFGLAKLLDHDESHVTTSVRGTVGHIAPEYLSTGQSSDKTDVYGFGILLLELVTGRRALPYGKGSTLQVKGGTVSDWKVNQEKKLDLLVDRNLGTNYDRFEVGEMIQVALLCTQHLPSHRPRMSEVVRMLEGDGLAGKWEASNKIQSNHDARLPNYNRELSVLCIVNRNDCGNGEGFVEMELSGPR